MKKNWIVMLALPWMISDPEPPQVEQKRRRKVPRWSKPAALALAELTLKELGPQAKTRIYNPTTGEYEAMAWTAEDEKSPERIKVFRGRESRE